MLSLLCRTAGEQGKLSLAEEPLGKGGEGSVYAVVAHDLKNLPPATELVVKLYHNPGEGERRAKLIAMLQAPAESSSVAWPLALALKPDGTFAGYVMMKLAGHQYRPWAELAHAQQRRATSPSFDVRYGLTACRNLAVAIASVHAAGHRVGDINESNSFCGSDASVLLVDMDSAQVQAPSGQVYPCLVGKPEYTAPELTHGSLRHQKRTEESDVFAFAVATFQMLTGGAHPADGIFTGAGDPPSTIDKLRRGILPGLGAFAGEFKPAPRIPGEAIPSLLRAALLASLQPDPVRRPPMGKLIAALDSVLQDLTPCSRDKHHWYAKRDGSCGWCRHADAGRPDPWAAAPQPPRLAVAQTTLAPVSFGSHQVPPQVKRAPAAVAGPPAGPATASVPPMTMGGGSGYAPPPPVPQPGTHSHSPPQQQNLPSAPPQKRPGGKTMLTYADGHTAPRPPLRVLFRSNPKLAISCIKSETPVWMRPWWSQDRPLAHQQGLIFGLVVGLLSSVAWFLLFTALSYRVPVEANWHALGVQGLYILSFLASFATAASSVTLLMTGFADRALTLRRAAPGTRFKEDGFADTVVRFPLLALAWGPVFALGLTAMLVWGVVQFIFSILPSSKRI